MSFWGMDSLNPYSSLTNISTFPSFELLVTSINHPNWCLTGKHPNNFPEQTYKLHLSTAGGMAWFVGWSTLVCPTAEHSGGVNHSDTSRRVQLTQLISSQKFTGWKLESEQNVLEADANAEKTDLIGCKMWKFWCRESNLMSWYFFEVFFSRFVCWVFSQW